MGTYGAQGSTSQRQSPPCRIRQVAQPRPKAKEERLEIFIPNGPRLGNKVIEAHGLAKSYGDKKLFKDLEFMLPPNGIVGVIGPNGAGKTTLFRLIMGQEKADAGQFSVGDTVKSLTSTSVTTTCCPKRRSTKS